MPPTKSGAKGKKKVAEAAAPAEVSEFDVLSLDDLQKIVLEMEAERESLSRLRNQAQVDRDAVERFVDITKSDLLAAKHSIGAMERDIEKCEAGHRAEVRVMQQRVKFLEYSHSRDVAAVASTGTTALQAEAEGHAGRVTSEVARADAVRASLLASDAAAAETARVMKVAHEKNVAKLRQEFAHNLEELRRAHESRFAALRRELTLRHKVEVHEVEQRRNEHISELSAAHEAAFAEMRAYYNDITRANLDLVAALKVQISEAGEKQGANQRLMLEIAEENKRLSDPLARATAELTSLQSDLRDAEKDRQSLEFARSRLAASKSQLASLRRTHAGVTADSATIGRERDDLQERFEEAVAAASQRSETRCAALEEAVASTEHSARAASAAIRTTVQSSQLDPAIAARTADAVAQELGQRERRLGAAHVQLAALQKACDDADRVLRVRVQELGVREEEIETRMASVVGMGALQSPDAAVRCRGPAGLVAVPAVP